MRKHIITDKILQRGFTIVELMIATLVFSVILVLITTGVIHFTNSYYRGINSSTTQNTTRTIIDTVSQAIQFGGGQFDLSASGGTVTTYCVKNYQFDFVIGKQVVTSSPGATRTYNALYKSSPPVAGGGGCTARALSGITGGAELLGQHMRLTKFAIVPLANSLFAIDVGVAYGDDDLLCDATIAPSSPYGCGPNAASFTAASQIAAAGRIACKSQTGSQFCAVSELSTTVQSRVQ